MLTEERPKINVIKSLINKFYDDYNLKKIIKEVKIKPIFKDKKFQFNYIIEGIQLDSFLKLVEGNAGSFLDHLIFYQENEPIYTDRPLYVVEETKTTPSESRNVSVYQRLTKFVFIDLFENLSQSKKIMFYNIRLTYSTIPKTFVFGIKLMKTLGIEIMGVDVNDKKYVEFKNLSDLIKIKNSFSTKRKDNIPIYISKPTDNRISISSKLVKANRLGHDPNIGTVTSLAKIIKKLCPSIQSIVITKHGLSQNMINNTSNKFIKLALSLGITLEGLIIKPIQTEYNQYWKYSDKGEKIVSILFHLILEDNKIKVIYENHAGSEQGYFEFESGKLESIPKKIHKPDLIFINEDEKKIYIIEAEKSKNVFVDKMGISQLTLFNEIENKYCKQYKNYECIKFVICFGDDVTQLQLNTNPILFQLKFDGTLMFSKKCPTWIIQLFTNYDMK